MNFPYKSSIDQRLIFYNITRCYSDGEYCHVFVIAAGDIIKDQGGHMMHNANARTVRSRQKTSTATTQNNFVVYGQKHKAWVLVFLVRTRGTR